jgi:hypothetical protein
MLIWYKKGIVLMFLYQFGIKKVSILYQNTVNG